MILSIRLRKLITALLLASVFITVASCGGGGGSNDVSSNGGSGVSQAPQRNLDELYVLQENELAAVVELNVEVQINADRSFLSICGDPGEELNVNTIDYDHCILRAPIDNNLSRFKIMLPNHIDSMVAIVWFYEPDKQPIVQRWQRSSVAGAAIDVIWHVSENG